MEILKLLIEVSDQHKKLKECLLLGADSAKMAVFSVISESKQLSLVFLYVRRDIKEIWIQYSDELNVQEHNAGRLKFW